MFIDVPVGNVTVPRVRLIHRSCIELFVWNPELVVDGEAVDEVFRLGAESLSRDCSGEGGPFSLSGALIFAFPGSIVCILTHYAPNLVFGLWCRYEL